jgi:hypothetical protein
MTITTSNVNPAVSSVKAFFAQQRTGKREMEGKVSRSVKNRANPANRQPIIAGRQPLAARR